VKIEQLLTAASAGQSLYIVTDNDELARFKVLESSRDDMIDCHEAYIEMWAGEEREGDVLPLDNLAFRAGITPYEAWCRHGLHLLKKRAEIESRIAHVQAMKRELNSANVTVLKGKAGLTS